MFVCVCVRDAPPPSDLASQATLGPLTLYDSAHSPSDLASQATLGPLTLLNEGKWAELSRSFENIQRTVCCTVRECSDRKFP